MMKDDLKSQLPSHLLGISQKCAAAALAAAGIVITAQPATASTPTTTTPPAVTATQPEHVEQMGPGAILLDIVRTDPVTGQQIADHYSHASHDSHASHSSHYSSRP